MGKGFQNLERDLGNCPGKGNSGEIKSNIDANW